jgi:hypothetical protein
VLESVHSEMLLQVLLRALIEPLIHP